MNDVWVKLKRNILRLLHYLYVKRYAVVGYSRDDLLTVISKIRPKRISEVLVRVGSDNDGGYLVPESMSYLDVLVSPGVSANSSFELYFANRGAKCFLFDASVCSPACNHSNFAFEKKFWGVHDRGEYISASRWISQNLKGGNSHALQMDIEGGEYEVILDLPNEQLKKFDLIVIEIHRFHKLLDSRFRELYLSFFEKLTLNHVVVHFHANNNISPCKLAGIDILDCFELTLVKKDYAHFLKEDKRFEYHLLDSPCVPSEKEVYVNWGTLYSEGLFGSVTEK